MFQELFPIVATSDMERALAFYRDAMGAVPNYQFPADGEPQFVALALGPSTVGLARSDKPVTAANDRISLWVYVSDCDVAVERLRAAGARIVAEPAEQPWGERIAIVADPDGNHVIIGAREPQG